MAVAACSTGCVMMIVYEATTSTAASVGQLSCRLFNLVYVLFQCVCNLGRVLLTVSTCMTTRLTSCPRVPMTVGLSRSRVLRCPL